MTDWTLEFEINDVKSNRPHVVLLGAGASRAAFPNGDASGFKLPVMDDLIDILNLKKLFDDVDIETKNKNFEEIFSYCYDQVEYKPLVDELEKRVYQYFSNLKLPDKPTIYDYLVLSLREKDLIATFNWDPFLWQACERNCSVAPLPKTIFLHGNVCVGYDEKANCFGPSGKTSPKTGNFFSPSLLLYPISKKDYNSAPGIKKSWEYLNSHLKSAFILSIFGYGAPKTDIEARRLMKSAWGKVEKRAFEEIEIIDIKDDEELRKTWQSFIHTHHYQTTNDFHSSIIFKHPRRTCEAIYNQTQEAMWLEENMPPTDTDFDSLWRWYDSLISAEKN